MINHYDLIEEADDPSVLNNNTENLSWLNITPHISQAPQHIVVVTDRDNTGSETENGPGSETGRESDVYSEIDLHSNQSAVYTRPDKSGSQTQVKQEKVEYITPNKHIKVRTVIVEVCVIILLLILLAHIAVIEVIKTTPDNDILKTDLRNGVKWKL